MWGLNTGFSLVVAHRTIHLSVVLAHKYSYKCDKQIFQSGPCIYLFVSDVICRIPMLSHKQTLEGSTINQNKCGGLNNKPFIMTFLSDKLLSAWASACGLSGDKHPTQASPLTIRLSLRKVMINAV